MVILDPVVVVVVTDLRHPGLARLWPQLDVLVVDPPAVSTIFAVVDSVSATEAYT